MEAKTIETHWLCKGPCGLKRPYGEFRYRTIEYGRRVAAKPQWCLKCRRAKSRKEKAERRAQNPFVVAQRKARKKAYALAYSRLNKEKIKKRAKEQYQYKRSDRDNRFRVLLSAAQNRATKRNQPYELDLIWLNQQWEDQNGCCQLTGIPLTLEGKRHPFGPSLDRRNSKEGYTLKNTRLVSNLTNTALNNFGEEILIYFAKALVKKQTQDGSLQDYAI